jgi:hypothetical protein
MLRVAWVLKLWLPRSDDVMNELFTVFSVFVILLVSVFLYLDMFFLTREGCDCDCDNKSLFFFFVSLTFWRVLWIWMGGTCSSFTFSFESISLLFCFLDFFFFSIFDIFSFLLLLNKSNDLDFCGPFITLFVSFSASNILVLSRFGFILFSFME